MNPNAAEYSVQRNYLDLLIELPWNEFTTDNFDLKKLEFYNGVKFIYYSLNFGFNYNIVIKWFRLLLINPTDKIHKKIAKSIIKNLIKK